MSYDWEPELQPEWPAHVRRIYDARRIESYLNTWDDVFKPYMSPDACWTQFCRIWSRIACQHEVFRDAWWPG